MLLKNLWLLSRNSSTLKSSKISFNRPGKNPTSCCGSSPEKRLWSRAGTQRPAFSFCSDETEGISSKTKAAQFWKKYLKISVIVWTDTAIFWYFDIEMEWSFLHSHSHFHGKTHEQIMVWLLQGPQMSLYVCRIWCVARTTLKDHNIWNEQCFDTHTHTHSSLNKYCSCCDLKTALVYLLILIKFLLMVMPSAQPNACCWFSLTCREFFIPNSQTDNTEHYCDAPRPTRANVGRKTWTLA